MDASTLKTDLHKVIDELDDKKLLERFYQEILTPVSNSKKLWPKLSEQQQQNALKSFEQSKNKNNLIDHNSVMNKYKDLL
ncbi:MAG TPA: hypothetical protein VFG39_02350 [Balneolaceae bacterium]|nr:hypothetical protein [Balneolaceae bacterium]